MRNDWRSRVHDIIDSIEEARRFTAKMSEEEFAKDRRTIRAVSADIALASEAARRVPTEVAFRFPDIPWEPMSELRTRILREDYGPDPAVLWQTIHADLIPLLPSLKGIRDSTTETGER